MSRKPTLRAELRHAIALAQRAKTRDYILGYFDNIAALVLPYSSIGAGVDKMAFTEDPWEMAAIMALIRTEVDRAELKLEDIGVGVSVSPERDPVEPDSANIDPEPSRSEAD
jgi:hypothetical protein